MKIYLQTIFAPVVSNLLYLAIFGLSLSRSVPVEGLSYLQFLVPGLIIMGIINNAYQNPASSLIIMKYQGTISELMAVPLTRFEIFIAFIGSAVLRGLLVGMVTFITGIFFVNFTYESIPVLIVAALLVALFFSALGMIVGIWASDFDKHAFVQNFILTPLIFLGGVFYPVTALPGKFANVAQVNPIVYMIDLLRFGLSGVHEFAIAKSLLVVSAATLIVSLIAYLLLRSGYKLQN